jgi:hypothetical protein
MTKTPDPRVSADPAETEARAEAKAEEAEEVEDAEAEEADSDKPVTSQERKETVKDARAIETTEEETTPEETTTARRELIEATLAKVA